MQYILAVYLPVVKLLFIETAYNAIYFHTGIQNNIIG